MKKSNIFRYIFIGFLGLLVLVASAAIIDCTGGGGGGGGDDDDDSATNYVISTGGNAVDIQLTAGQTTTRSFEADTPGPART